MRSVHSDGATAEGQRKTEAHGWGSFLAEKTGSTRASSIQALPMRSARSCQRLG